MDLTIIVLYALALLGPIMVFLTHFVVKGRTRDMTRLWFITFFAYMVFYWLAKSYNYFNDPNDIVYAYALLWPIASILAFWIYEKVTEKGSYIAFLRWMVYFLVAVIFAFILDGAAGMFNLYSYNSAVLGQKTSMVDPIGGLQIPGLMPFLLGLLMLLVFYLVFHVHKVLRKRRIDETSATLLLAALSIILGGILWVVADLILHYVTSFM